MSDDWTASIVGRLHTCRITKKQLAGHLGYTPEYVSMVLNGHREPKGAEQRFNAALDELIDEQRPDEKTA